MNQLTPTALLAYRADSGYDTDYLLWIERQRSLLQAQQFEQLDLDNIIEEFGAMAINQRHEVRSRVEVLLMHLRKCQFQPEHKSVSWLGTIHEQRSHIEQRLEDSPSLRKLVGEFALKRYASAVRWAASDTGLPVSCFPEFNLYTEEQLLDPDFVP